MLIRRIIQNEAKCRKCKAVIISYTVHDFVYCTCGSISVDGGNEYIKRTFDDLENLIELSSFEYSYVEDWEARDRRFVWEVVEEKQSKDIITEQEIDALLTATTPTDIDYDYVGSQREPDPVVELTKVPWVKEGTHEYPSIPFAVRDIALLLKFVINNAGYVKSEIDNSELPAYLKDLFKVVENAKDSRN